MTQIHKTFPINQIGNNLSPIEKSSHLLTLNLLAEFTNFILYFIANAEVITKNYPTKPYGDAYWNSVREVKVDFKGKFNKQIFMWI